MMNNFNTVDEAWDWLEARVDDPFMDNYRFAYCDDERSVEFYKDKKSHGCCGFSDHTVSICGRLAFIGCNYGH